MLVIYIDADACPVKEEIYKVAGRYNLKVVVVSNKAMKVPHHPNITAVVVGGKLDEADEWIAEHIEEGDILVTGDIPLADKALKKGAVVLGSKGKEFTLETIGEAMATREVMNFLRDSGSSGQYHAPFEKKDRSLFLSKLDQIIQSLKRKYS